MLLIGFCQAHLSQEMFMCASPSGFEHGLQAEDSRVLQGQASEACSHVHLRQPVPVEMSCGGVVDDLSGAQRRGVQTAQSPVVSFSSVKCPPPSHRSLLHAPPAVPGANF